MGKTVEGDLRENVSLLQYLLIGILFGHSLGKVIECTHEEYTVDYANGTIACDKCPLCWKGTGLVYECAGSTLGANDTRQCVPCPNGTYNSISLARVICNLCNEHEHRKVTRNCTSTHDREYGKCVTGFHWVKEGRCEICSCCAQGNKQVIQKCKDDGLPANMQCRKVPGQDCAVSTTALPSTAKPTSNAADHNLTVVKEPTSNESSRQGKSVKVTPEGSGDGQQAPFGMMVLFPGAVVLFTALLIIGSGVFLIYMQCRSRRTGNQCDIELCGVGARPCPSRVADCVSVTDPQQQPLISEDPGSEQSAGHYSGPAEVTIQGPEEMDTLQLPATIPVCRLSKIPTGLKYYLCMELDSDRKCHAVAEKFGLSEDQRKIMEIAGEKRRDSATKAMFTALEARGNNEPFLKKLVGILVSLGLRDIVDNWDWNTNERKSNAHDALKSVTKAASTPTKNGIKDMKGNAQKKGFQLQSDNPGRGNCMFFALLDQVARLGIQGFTEPQPLREELVDFLKQNPTLNDGTLLSNFLDGHSTWNDYLAEMRKDGAWGDHLVLLAAANVFQRPIMVITSLLHNVEILIRPTHVSAGQVSDDLMLLGHVAGSHYVSLEPCLVCRLSKMPDALKNYLIVELDLSEDPLRANCHDVAKEFEFSVDTRKGLTVDEQKRAGSPTETMFSVLKTWGNEEPTVYDLVKILIKVDRRDIINNWDWVANTRIEETPAIPTDASRSTWLLRLDHIGEVGWNIR